MLTLFCYYLGYTIFMKVNNKNIIVTGAGGGIGQALVTELLKRGAHVIAVDLRDDSLQKLSTGLKDQAKNLTIETLDITDRAAVEKFAASSTDIDGVINNAGIIQPFVKINDLEFEAIERVINVNFYGTLHMIKSLLPQLLTRPEAHIINVSSMGGFLPVPGQSIYGASKAAVKLMSEGLYAELLDTTVSVSTVFPGATETNISGNSGVTANIDAETAKKQAGKIKMLAPSEAARIIIDGIEANKPLIYTGSDSNMMNRIYRLSPVRATKLIAKQMRQLLK